MIPLLDCKHLVLLDLNSTGLFFYLAKDVKTLPSLDFSNLSALGEIVDENLCKRNLLFDDERTCKLIEDSLKGFELSQALYVFLLSPEFSSLEKELLNKSFSFWQKVTFVDRHFFYNFYLMQKRNFSRIKFLINMFTDCAELSIFDQEKLLAYKRIDLQNLAFSAKHFLDKTMAEQSFEKPECFYFFTNNFPAKMPVGDLASYLKMEAISIEKVC